jgi:pesticin/yersiniabactin receptor
LVSSTFLVGAVLWSAQARAHDEAAAQNNGDSIVVTAGKRTQPLASVDGQVAIATPAALDPRGFQGVEQLDRLFADLSIRARSSRAFANVTIRGQSSVDFYNPSTQLYVDGLPQDQALFFQLMPVGLDRVEVLYGPQGTLYGRGAVGGVINVVTQAPGNEPHLQAMGTMTELGETGQVRVSTPIVKDALYADALFAARREQGELRGMTSGDRLGGSKTETGRVRLRYAPVDGKVDLMLSWQRNIVRSDEEYFVLEPLFAQRRALEIPSHYRLRTNSYGLTAAFDLGSATLTTLTGYQDRDLDRTVFGSYTPETQRTFSQELRLASKNGGAIDYVAGLYFEDLRFRRTVPANALGSYQKIRTYAAFGELTWHATDRLDFTPGLRVSWEETKANTYYGAIGMDNATGKTSLLPKLSVGYQASDVLRLYGVFSTGFKAGGFTRAVTPATIAYSYAPQHSYNYELGARVRSPDGRYQASVAAYYILSTDFQLSVGPADGMYLQNVGKVKSKGINFNARAEPLDGLKLTVAAALNDSWFSRYDNALNPGVDLSGNAMPYTPSGMLNANAQYDIRLPGDGGTISPHGGISVIGKTWFDESNSIAQARYTLLDAGLRWQTGKGIAVDLYGDNLTDRRYAVYAFNAGPGIGNAYQLGRGRELGVRLSLSY